MPATGTLPRRAASPLESVRRRLDVRRSTLAWLVPLLAFIAFIAFARPALAQDTGYIQVQCEPGLQIFLDGILKGVSNRDQEGLIIEDVPVGTRIVKAVKPGFTPQEQRITVGKGEVVVVRIAALRPRPVVEQGGDEQGTSIQLKVGTVLIKSLPVECTVTLERSSGGGWDSIGRVDKTKPEARVSNLEIGTYRVTASRANGTLSKTFDLAESDEVTVFFNFVGKSVEVSSAAAEARRAEEARRVEEARRAEEVRRANEAFVAAGGQVIDLGSGVSMRLVEIKPGRFMMGSPASEQGRDSDETQHSVTITKSFWLGQTEVTQAQWQAVMGSNPSHFSGNPDNPVERVTRSDAMSFCWRLSQKTGMTFRLPTEAEWEYACRAGTTTAYSFGNDESRLGEYAWFSDNSGRTTKPVATKKPNAWGLHDMHGNVWEWCSDWYGDYPSRAATDPQGGSGQVWTSGKYGVLRGGSWSDNSGDCRAANRSEGHEPGTRVRVDGFRVARTPLAAEARRAEEARRVEEARRAAEARRANEVFVAAGGQVIDLGSGVSMRLVEIKPGRFMMGSPASEPKRDADETQHSVTITQTFWLGQTEVTQAQWQAVMGSNPSHFKGNPNHPVEMVSWNDAQEYCRRLSQMTGKTFRLPTEAEWEYACRAGTTTAYSFGDEASRLGEHAWFHDNAGGSTKPVATNKRNPWGLCDMHGNVWEWCSDWYGVYPSGAATDPQGPRSGEGRVLRGGGWGGNSRSCRAAYRRNIDPRDRSIYGGFRVAMTP